LLAGTDGGNQLAWIGRARMSDKVSLVQIEGATSIYIDAEITDEGDLLFSGQDIGQVPSEMFGDSDYEYWLTIKAVNKDKVLLALIEKLYSGNSRLISELMDYLKSKGIPYEFHSYS
jgi:hypothetical protein